MLNRIRICLMRSTPMLLTLIICILMPKKSLAVSMSQFNASITGITVVDDHQVFYDLHNGTIDSSDVVFSSPQTHIVVPYGKTLLFRMSYDFPDGYGCNHTKSVGHNRAP